MLEIILEDDGFPKRCGAICDEWAKKDQKLSDSYSGLYDAQNSAVQPCI